MRWRYCICDELFEDWPLQRAASFAAEVGYQGLELAPFTLCRRVTDLTPEDRDQIRRSVESAGLEVAGLHWLLARTEGLRLNDPDPEVRERTEAYLLALIKFCADLGGKVLTFGSPQQRDIPSDRSREAAVASAVEIFRRCGEEAERRGVLFCLESLSGSNFLTTARETLEIVHMADRPGLQMMLHVPKNVTADGRSLSEILDEAAPHLFHIHVNDPNGLGPGMGEADFLPILRALRQVDYDGWISVEVFDFAPGPERIARESLAYLERCEKSLD